MAPPPRPASPPAPDTLAEPAPAAEAEPVAASTPIAEATPAEPATTESATEAAPAESAPAEAAPAETEAAPAETEAAPAETEAAPAEAEAEAAPKKRRRRRRRAKDDDSKERARTVSGRQQELVLGVIRRAYPNAVSHADICAEVGTNRASHRIRELSRMGWKIEGAGILGLDPVSQTQLYRLSSLEQGPAHIKHFGLKVLWDTNGLKVSLHRDVDGDIEPEVLLRVVRRVEALVRDDLADLIPSGEAASDAEANAEGATAEAAETDSGEAAASADSEASVDAEDSAATG